MEASGRQQVINNICRALQGLSFDIQLVLRGFTDQKLCPFEVTTVLQSTASFGGKCAAESTTLWDSVVETTAMDLFMCKKMCAQESARTSPSLWCAAT